MPTRQTESQHSLSRWSSLSGPLFKAGGRTHLLDNDWNVQGLGLSAGWKLPFFLLETLALRLSQLVGVRARRTPPPTPVSAPRPPWPSSAEWALGASGKGIWVGRVGWGPHIPRTLAPSQYQCVCVLGGAGLKDKDSLWAPVSPPPSPHTRSPSGHRCGMETPPTSWDTLSLWAGLLGRGQGKGPSRSCQLPTGRLCTHQWGAGSSAAAACALTRCARSSGRAPARLQSALRTLPLLDGAT